MSDRSEAVSGSGGPPSRSPSRASCARTGCCAVSHAGRGGGGAAGRRGRERGALLGAALEGLRKFGHLISLEYFADLTSVLVGPRPGS